MKRCCSLGCTRVRQGKSEGYQVGFGFMLWACPDHAEQFRQFDIARHDYEEKYDKAYQGAFENFEKVWIEQYEKKHPEPIPPAYQPSEI